MQNRRAQAISGPSLWLLLALCCAPTPIGAMCTNPPLAVADEVLLEQSLAAVDVLANDSEPDGEALDVDVIGGSCLGLGSFDVLGGVVSYHANPGPATACIFTYRATDETGLSSTATVNVLLPVGLFSDGFETGNANAWSIVVP